MVIDNPKAVNFVEQYSRQIARSILLFKVAGDYATSEWVDLNLQHFFAGEHRSEVVQDQNVLGHPVTGQDIIDWARLLESLRTVLDDPANADKLAACQRLAVTRILG